MDRLWTPWRYEYLTKSGPAEPCIFCAKAAENKDAENFLEDSARRFGLNDKERTDFVSFWIPALMRNPL